MSALVSCRLAVIRTAAVGASAIGTIVLVGWLLDVRVLKQLSPGLSSMKANTAAMLLVAGVALWSSAGGEARPRRFPLVAGAAVCALALLTLLEYVWRSLGIDQLVFHDALRGHPGRPSPHTAIVLALVGTNLMLLSLSGAAQRFARWANAAGAVAVMLALIGYAYGVDFLRDLDSTTGVAPQTLAGLVLLVVGLAFVQPSAGWLGLVAAPGPGGRMARAFAPLVVVTPLLIGLEHRFYDSTLGRALTAFFITGFAIAVLLRGAATLERLEAERETLAGLLPICSHCKSIRDDQGYWQSLEHYIESHSEAEFSHSLCSSCLAEHYPQFAEEIERRLAEGAAGG